MYDLMIYCLKVGACLAVFYLFFKLLLSRETFHRLNRIVVLGAMVLSFVLPLCVITVYRELPAVPDLDVLTDTALTPVQDPQLEPFPWAMLAGAVFLAGAGMTLATTLCSLLGVLHVIRRGKRERLSDGSVLVVSPKPVTPFSWGRYIVLSEEDMAESGREIIIHEQAHLRLHHSLDLLVTDIVGCLQWFNPAMWLLRRELRAIHEYEAVLGSGIDAKSYQLLLIKKAAGGRWYSVANSFNHSKLKNRITMMLRKKSSRWAGAKTLVVLPLTALALGAFAQTAYVFPEDKVKKENVTVTVSGTDISVHGLKGKAVRVVDGREVEPSVLDTVPADRIDQVQVTTTTTTGDSAEKTDNSTVHITMTREGDRTGYQMQMSGAVATGAQTPKVRVFTISGCDSIGGGPKQQSGNDDTIVIRGSGNKNFDQNVIWIVDGREVSSENMSALKPQDIESISVLKDDATFAAEYPGREVDGIIVVTTKAAAKADGKLEKGQKELSGKTVGKVVRIKTSEGEAKVSYSDAGEETVTVSGGQMPDNTLFYIDGKQASKEDVAKIAPEKIKRMNVLKGEKAVKKYGDKGRSGVIEIQTHK